MSKEGLTSKSYGVGFLDLMTIMFIGLKITNLITWSWWWVLAPTWVPVTLVIVLTVAVALAK